MKMKHNKENNLFVDAQTQEHKHQTIGEIISDRLGKVDEHEVYFSTREILNIFPNGYSVTITQRNSRKHADVRVYKELSDVTRSFFPNRGNRSLRPDIISKFVEKIESL